MASVFETDTNSLPALAERSSPPAPVMTDLQTLTSFGFHSLAIIYIGSHMKKQLFLAYWSLKKEKREVQLTALTQQLLTNHSCPELPRGTGKDYNGFAMYLWHRLQDLPHSSFFSTSQLNLDLFIIITRMGPSGGHMKKEIAPYIIHVTFTSPFKCICRLRRHCDLHTERTTIFKWPCYM